MGVVEREAGVVFADSEALGGPVGGGIEDAGCGGAGHLGCFASGAVGGFLVWGSRGWSLRLVSACWGTLPGVGFGKVLGGAISDPHSPGPSISLSSRFPQGEMSAVGDLLSGVGLISR